MTSEKKNSLVTTKTIRREKLVPPDGGWGWMVLFGTALSNIFNQSMLSLYSLLYGGALKSMGYETQGAAFVLSTMLFVTNFGGPIAGAVIKLTSPRFVAVIGACSCTAGIFFSGFSTNIIHLALSYGVLLGLGLGFIQNSSFVAINSYFKLRKSRAVGLANAGTGLGQTLMPHLVTYLLETYGFKGACLILSGLSLHGIAGTMLIQPVERHLKKVYEIVPIDESSKLLDEKNNNPLKISEKQEAFKNKRRTTEPDVFRNNFNENGSVKKAQSHIELNGYNNNKLRKPTNGWNPNNKKQEHEKQEEPPKKTILRKIYDLFDISLLSSPRFINILLGTALSVTSIQNFSLLFPLFLRDVAKLNMTQTATCMSAVAAADICGRLTLPILQDKFKIKARWMLIYTSVWLIVIRQILAYQTDLIALIVTAALYGFGRSMIIVARNIAISENCRQEQVPAAVGLGMFTMGVIVPPAGLFLGWIRDYTGSYLVCITAQNLLLLLLLITWVPDMLLIYIAERKKKALMKKKAIDVEVS